MKKILLSIFAMGGLFASAQMTDLPVSASSTTIVSGQNVQVITDGSQEGYVYLLRDNSNDALVDGPIVGTGNDLIFNTGAISSNTSYNVYGSNNFALNFNYGTEKVNFGDNNRGIDTAVTVAAWVKTTSAGLRNIVFDYGANDAGFVLRMDDGEAAISGRDGSGNFKTSGLASTLIDDGEWHYVVGTSNMQYWKIYVDGVLENDNNYGGSGVSMNNTDDLYLGRSFSTSSSYRGDLRDVTIWNKVLTDTEISDNMNACFTGSESDVVAHFPLKDGTGTTVKDYSSYGIDGQISGGNMLWINNDSLCRYTLEMSQIIDITVGAGSGIFVDSINVIGEDSATTITTNAGTLQMEATVNPSNVDDDTYTWSVVNMTGTATIDAAGILTAAGNGTVEVVATANDGSGIIGVEKITISNQTGTGINDLAFKNVNIYPNPTSGLVSIDLEEKLTSIKIMDLTGKTIKVFNAESTQLDISNFTTGIYFLEIANTERKSVVKVIKK